MQMEGPPERAARSIGEQVRHARKELGLRQDELALAAGISTRAVHQIEHGKPTGRLDTLARVLDVLGLELTVSERSRVRRPAVEEPR
jgi:HTH-type transcriptional regulator / antitoxin HipB